jgi:hypothetical protein
MRDQYSFEVGALAEPSFRDEVPPPGFRVGGIAVTTYARLDDWRPGRR